MAGHSDGAAWRPSPLSCTVEWQKPAAVVARKGENDQSGSAPKPHPPGWGGEVRCCAAGKKASRIAECKERRKADETGKPIVTTTRKAGGCVHSACTGSALAPGFCLCGGYPRAARTSDAPSSLSPAALPSGCASALARWVACGTPCGRSPPFFPVSGRLATLCAKPARSDGFYLRPAAIESTKNAAGRSRRRMGLPVICGRRPAEWRQ